MIASYNAVHYEPLDCLRTNKPMQQTKMQFHSHPGSLLFSSRFHEILQNWHTDFQLLVVFLLSREFNPMCWSYLFRSVLLQSQKNGPDIVSRKKSISQDVCIADFIQQHVSFSAIM
jgi:hypothetical protein